MQRIEDCPLDFNLVEITPIRDLPGQFGACAQQCESGLLKITFLKTIYSDQLFILQSTLTTASQIMNNFICYI